MAHRDRLNGFARFPLAHLPTPLEPLDALTAALGGPRLLVKRDDCTGLALGGNKTRKLEFLLADALAKDTTVLVSEGGLQSNHVRQTAAAAARAGLRCVLALDNRVGWPDPNYQSNGNLFLDRLLGATVQLCREGETREERSRAVIAELEAAGERPYYIPTGGSNAIGGLGYALCAQELLDQAEASGETIDHVVLASGSGGTQGGFLAGLRAAGSSLQCHGIDIDKDPEGVRDNVRAVADDTGALLGVAEPRDDDISIVEGFAEPGYGQPNAAMIEAVTLLARAEGLLLDPVYSGKAMAGLVALIRQGRFRKDETVVFIHTGGQAALFSYTSAFPLLDSAE